MLFRRTPQVSGTLPLNERRDGATKPDRRHAQRFIVERPIHIVFQNGELGVWLVECSSRGVGIVAPLPMTCGDAFLIDIGLSNLPCVTYQVRHCMKLWDAAYQIGAELGGNVLESQTAAILQALLRPPLQAAKPS